MQIHEKIHIVGSGNAGFGITHETDCTVYLIDGGDVCALIDTGGGEEPEQILEEIRKAVTDVRKVKYIFLTHGHGDHSGGANVLSRECDADVYALSETAEYVSTGNLDAISLKKAIDAGIYKKDYVFSPCKVNAVEENFQMQIGNIKLKVWRTEGHCSGHACYEMQSFGKKILFSGDTVFSGGRISLQSVWDCNLQKYIETCEKLETIHPDIILPSHGAFLLNRGWSYIEKAMDEIRRLGIPGNMI